MPGITPLIIGGVVSAVGVAAGGALGAVDGAVALDGEPEVTTLTAAYVVEQRTIDATLATIHRFNGSLGVGMRVMTYFSLHCHVTKTQCGHANVAPLLAAWGLSPGRAVESPKATVRRYATRKIG
jgi:hypothetical protein